MLFRRRRNEDEMLALREAESSFDMAIFHRRAYASTCKILIFDDI